MENNVRILKAMFHCVLPSSVVIEKSRNILINSLYVLSLEAYFSVWKLVEPILYPRCSAMLQRCALV